MKKEKEELYNKKILSALLPGEPCTVLQVAEQVGLSEKTVRTKLGSIEQWLKEENLGTIVRKQRVGVWLAVDESQRQKLQDYVAGAERSAVISVEADRKNQIIGKLLKLAPGETVTIQQLAEGLFLSAPTVTNLIKDVAVWFEERKLKLTSVKNKGICVMGEEYNFRVTIKDYMIETMPEVSEALLGTYARGVDIYKIRGMIVNAENAWRIELADISFVMVWIMTCLSVSRRQYLKEDSLQEIHVENIHNYNEYSFAESIYKRIREEYGCDIPEGDTLLLAVLLLAARKLENFEKIEETSFVQQYDADLQKFIHLLVNTVSGVLDVDLSDDKVLYDGLLMHVRSAIFRMKYQSYIKDHIAQHVKAEYKQVFLASWSTSTLFEKYYGLVINEDEIAYIALYIQAALLRRTSPLKAIFVSRQGLASTQLILEMVKFNLPEITDIYAVSLHDFRITQYKDVDLIITNAELDCTDGRIISIGQSFNEKSILTVRERVKEIAKAKKKETLRFTSLCHPLFDVDLLFVQAEFSNKDELLAYMARELEKRGMVTSAYLTSVMERERATTTSIGKGVAIPHGSMAEVNEPKVAIAVLKKPIEWWGDMVDIVFLISVKMANKYELKRTKQFYKDFARISDSDEELQKMRQAKTALELYQYLIR